MNFLNSILHTTAIKIGAGLLVLSHFFAPVSPTVLGDYNPTGAGTYRTQASISSTQTTVTLSSFKEPISNIKYTMSYLNSSVEYGTIEPQSTNREFISFTGITQNTDGTALLTGVSRGLSPSYPFTASTTFQLPHSGQSVFILSNPPQLTNQYANKSNAEYIPAQFWGFLDPPYAVNAATSSNQFATIGFVTATAFGSTPVVVSAGGTGLATLPLDMLLVGNGTGNMTSTSTPTVGAIIATSSSKTNYFAGPVIANSSLSVTGNTTLTGNLVASSTTNVIASSTQYTINVGSLNATSTIKLNGVSFANVTLFVGSDTTGTSNTSTTTSMTYTMPANTMGVNKLLKIYMQMSAGSVSGGRAPCDYNIDFGTGTATTTVGFGQIAVNFGNGAWGVGDMQTMMFASSTASEMFVSKSYNTAVYGVSGKNSGLVNTFSLGGGANDENSPNYLGATTTNKSLTAQTYIAFRYKSENGQVCYIPGAIIELLSQ